MLEGPDYGPRQRKGPKGRDVRIQGRVYAITSPAELADQPVIQGTFLLSLLWARVLFDSGASHSFIVALVMRELGLEIETLEEPMHVSSPLYIYDMSGLRVRDLWDSAHSGLEGHEYVRVRRHP